MKTKKIINGNKLIAEFEYGKRYNDSKDIEDCYVEEPTTSMITFYLEDAMYHKSWDWLMPVIEKIESLGYDVNIYSWGKGISKSCSIQGISIDVNNTNKLQAVYEAVVEFIKWYNKNK